MDDFITRAEHNQFSERIDAENHRQNERLTLVEQNLSKLTALTIAVDKMAMSMETMAKELKRQGERLENLENKPAKRMETIVTEIIKYAIAFGLGAILMRLGVAQ